MVLLVGKDADQPPPDQQWRLCKARVSRWGTGYGGRRCLEKYGPDLRTRLQCHPFAVAVE
jgi:hypothetical protein